MAHSPHLIFNLLVACAMLFGLIDAQAEIRTITAGWYKWEPYNFIEKKHGLTIHSGLDVELMRHALGKEDHTLHFEELAWHEQIKKLHAGQLGMAFGGLASDVDSSKVWVSQAYRWERMRFIYSRSIDSLDGHTAAELLKTLAKSNLRLGVCSGYSYGPVLNPFLKTVETSAQLFKAPDEYGLFAAFKNGEIDGFFADELVAETLAWNTRLYPLLKTHRAISQKNLCTPSFPGRECRKRPFGNSMRPCRR